MKVWNKDVESCSECMCKNTHDFDGSPYCNLTFKDVENNSVNKDCPFTQPITKEVIEGFGFKFNKYWKDYSIYKKNESIYYKDKVELWVADYNKGYVVYIKTNHVGEFKGIVNNPKELEFILHSIRVIE